MSTIDGDGTVVRRHRRDVGFTLIELLLVMGIMSVLASMVIGVGGYSIRKSRIAKARSNIMTISVALEAFDTVNGRLPGAAAPGPARDDPWALFLGLCTANPAIGEGREHHLEDWPTSAIGRWEGAFVDVYATPDEADLDFSSGVRARAVLLDPWGHAFHYVELDSRAPGDRRLGSGRPLVTAGRRYAIWSDGPDGINAFGEGDDVSSWNEGGT